MKPSLEDLQKELKARKIHLSYQRLKILEYLAEHQCHPTADQIFTKLQPEISTLSRTTVYNTLRILTEAGLLTAVTIEDHETRYDLVTATHGHFKCESCGKIYNFEIDADALVCKDLNHFKIHDKNVYFKGICPKCLSNPNETEG